MPKNIVLCCDGTGNEINDNHSNVLKLYRVLKRSAQQVVFYDPGIGTLGASNDWGRLKQKAGGVAGLALGMGLDRNVLDAYRFLVTNYKAGDRIYMFGFSRGAYTVRVLAGFINTLGLISPPQIHLSGYAFVAYKQISEGEGFTGVRLFEQALRPRRPSIRFLGLWDSVSSIIVPRRDRLYAPSLRQLAFTQRNPSVEIVRHALAIDERRRMFRPYLWSESEEYWGGPFKSDKAVPQDVKQVWFAGVHSDIGGGYPEKESGLSKIALNWMIDEAPDDLLFITQSVNQIVLGHERSGSRKAYTAPDACGPIHESLSVGWKFLEYLPKSNRRKEWPESRSLLGFYLPGGEPRYIPDGALVHASVGERLQNLPSYRPVNLPESQTSTGQANTP